MGSSRKPVDRNGRPLRDRARRAVVDTSPPSVPFAVPRTQSGLTAEVERSVLDLVLRAGEAMITTGTPVADTTAALLRMAAGFGVTSCQIDITFTSITASIDRDDDPITKVRVINMRTADYSRLSDLFELVDSAHKGQIDLSQAHRRLDKIVAKPHPYRRWVVTLALGGMAAGVAILLNGSWLVALIAAVTTMLVDRTLRWLRNKGLPYMFQQAIGAGIATGVALFLNWGRDQFGWSFEFVTPSLVVAAGIVVLLAGLSLVGAAEDAISGFPLTAAARSYEVLLYTIGIVVGVGFVLDLGGRMGIPLHVTDHSMLATPFAVQLVAGGVIAGAWGLASYSRPRTVAVAAGVGVLSAGSFLLVGKLGLGPVGSSFLAALVVGLVAGSAAERLGTPALAISVCGITPLLPGLLIYQAMFSMVDANDFVPGVTMLFSALGVGLALAAGVTLGEFMATPLRSEMDRWERRVRHRARGSRT
ncbi:threonine/serine exporter family protein [Actinobacteria bacterium YIM 96077]|uniref:Threonine/serine exporter family protein n=2 Tax=Phytoactinopolyspora halophila TaxID=1981511 RepID=A0A329R505_9ACTN|nr:threonine/serine exporter family protein [Actinobacteria bacterium YIM 96077]RAW18996.1 threonine/serine exporter family protein [Phytoactinopolyspora halophila]